MHYSETNHQNNEGIAFFYGSEDALKVKIVKL